jgi:hypothetical protein
MEPSPMLLLQPLPQLIGHHPHHHPYVDNSPIGRGHVVKLLHVVVSKICSQVRDITPVQQHVHTNEDDQHNREPDTILKDTSELIKQIVRTITSIQMYIIVICAFPQHTIG